MLFLARMVVAFMLAATGQVAVMNTMLLGGAHPALVFVVGVAVFAAILNLTAWRDL